MARILEPHVERVVVVSPDDTGIAQARAKDRPARRPHAGEPLWKGKLEAVWMPDERGRALRRRFARREQLVRTRTRVKNEMHAVLMRRLKGKPPCSDLFGVKGRKWLRQLSLLSEEAESSHDRASSLAKAGDGRPKRLLAAADVGGARRANYDQRRGRGHGGNPGTSRKGTDGHTDWGVVSRQGGIRDGA